MKSSASKPISSPGRADKYPPPLMRFLRSNAGSKSRGRSRATPLFTRRKRAAIDAAQQQEPSSPKVTCIGQVRVRRSSSSRSKQPGPKTRDPPPLKRRPSLSSSGGGAGNWFCFWVGKPPAICCSFRFSSCCRRKPGCFRPLWRKWVSFFCCRRTRVRTDSSKKVSIPTGTLQIYSDSDDSYDLRRHRFEDREDQYSDEEEEEEEGLSLGERSGPDASTTPPKNALLLTRCRSAPHRSSYLASQNWGSDEEPNAKTGDQHSREIATEKAVRELSPSGTEQILHRDSVAESIIDRQGEGNLEICKEAAAETEFVGRSNKTETAVKLPTAQKADEGREKGGNQVVEKGNQSIVMLTRCKSEPARSSGDPLTSSFWRERRLESAVSCRNSIESK